MMVKRQFPPFEGSLALPGGHVDSGETFREAAVREALEETGLGVSGVVQLGVYDAPDRDPRGRVVSVAFMARNLGGAVPVAGDDAAEVRWVPVRRVVSGEVLVAFDHRQMVVDAYRLGCEWWGWL